MRSAAWTCQARKTTGWSCHFREKRPALHLAFSRGSRPRIHLARIDTCKDRDMAATAKCSIGIVALLCAISPAYATSCGPSIARVQADVDAAIEQRAGSLGWQRESLNATRNYQPTPRSLAAAEGLRGRGLEAALESLDRARAAESNGNVAVCQREVAAAESVLRSQQR